MEVSRTAQELCDVLEVHFPKLVEGGGFELLRTEEGCPRELVVIPIPDAGYTVEYLKAIVHNAKIFIRPLQSDLNLDPCPAEVTVITLLHPELACNAHCRMCFRLLRKYGKNVVG